MQCQGRNTRIHFWPFCVSPFFSSSFCTGGFFLFFFFCSLTKWGYGAMGVRQQQSSGRCQCESTGSSSLNGIQLPLQRKMEAAGPWPCAEGPGPARLWTEPLEVPLHHRQPRVSLCVAWQKWTIQKFSLANKRSAEAWVGPRVWKEKKRERTSGGSGERSVLQSLCLLI